LAVDRVVSEAIVIGRAINNYEVRQLIGEGGMGTVYLAQHPVLERTAAVKVLRRAHVEDEDMVARFMNEARAANAIHHPHIIEVLDVGRLDDGLPYILMEHLEGETLGQRLRRLGRAPLPQTLTIIGQTAAALGAAHAGGVVHRDLKPDNIYLARDTSGGERVKVLDFGIAKLRGDRSRHRVDTQRAMVGTPVYMAPEQCRGSVADPDGRSDIYALGTVMYEMLCGHAPFDKGGGYGDVLVMHLLEPPLAPRAVVPELPVEIEGVILRALAKDPGERFATMEELLVALRDAASAAGVVPAPLVAEAPMPVPPFPPADQVTPVVPVSALLARQTPARQTPARQTPATFTSLVAPTTMVIPRGVPRWWLPASLTVGALILALTLWPARSQRDDEGLALPHRPGPQVAQPAPPAPAPPPPAPPPPAPAPAAATAPGPGERAPLRVRARARKSTAATPRAEPARAPQPARRIQKW
jgi:serine/threonine-protein kinase